MMAAGKWEGFTEEDIKYYLKDESGNQENDLLKKKIVNFGNKPRNIPRETKSNLTKQLTHINDLPEAALLLKPKAVEHVSPGLTELCKGQIDKEIPVSIGTQPRNAKETESIKNDAVLGETLEMFHARQKLLEEQNRQRKDYLARILSDRKKQTTQEAMRLQKIQEELHKLDILLSDDVSILRDEIEVASKEFGEAQKRYNRAEKEFLEAKQTLFGKMERKELLTKHLCTIIEQNEVRKAQKLSELMDKLAVQEGSVSEHPQPIPIENEKKDVSKSSSEINVSGGKES